MRKKGGVFVLALLPAFLAGDGAAAAQQPWIEPVDTAMAANRPDEYAWRLFVALNWPAIPKKREPDPNKKLGADGMVVWESWKNEKEVFLPKGADPSGWLDDLPEPVRKIEDLDPLPLQLQIKQSLERAGGARLLQPDPKKPQANEVRMNRPSFEFIVKNQLYHLGGQEAFYQKGTRVEFPQAAKEIKAQWRQIKEKDKPRYHWTTIIREGKPETWGLTALHITTKDLPNWFWTTFEHEDNPSLENAEAWLLPSRDAFACPQEPLRCNQAPDAVGNAVLKGTKWQHYRLRGTQLDFLDATGRPTLLANSQVEQGFQLTSSCITCHALATIGPRVQEGNPKDLANRIFFFEVIPAHELGAATIQGRIGVPGPDLFEVRRFLIDNNDGPPHRTYLPLDFVWSLMRAERKPTP